MSTTSREQASREDRQSPVLVRELRAHHRARLLQHFLALSEDDRFLRFGQAATDEVITHYVDSIDFENDAIFGVFNERLQIIGAGHLAYPCADHPEKIAEFGVSVASEARGQGVGSALFDRGAMHARNTAVQTLYIHCLARNAAMMHIARKAGMEVHYAYGEADAYLKLPPADPASLITEALQSQIANFDYALRRNLRETRRFTARIWNNLLAANRTA